MFIQAMPIIRVGPAGEPGGGTPCSASFSSAPALSYKVGGTYGTYPWRGTLQGTEVATVLLDFPPPYSITIRQVGATGISATAAGIPYLATVTYVRIGGTGQIGSFMVVRDPSFTPWPPGDGAGG